MPPGGELLRLRIRTTSFFLNPGKSLAKALWNAPTFPNDAVIQDLCFLSEKVHPQFANRDPLTTRPGSLVSLFGFSSLKIYNGREKSLSICPSHRMYSTKSEPYRNRGLRVIRAHRRRSVRRNKCRRAGGAGSSGGRARAGQRCTCPSIVLWT